MLMTETVAVSAVRFSVGKFEFSSVRRLSSSISISVPRIKYNKCGVSRTRVTSGNTIRANVKGNLDASSGSKKPNNRYHPSEEIGELELLLDEEATLTPAETIRTMIEVNSKATLVFAGMVSEEIRENIFWPDLPYLTDEHGNIYFQVKNEDDILQTLTTEETIVQAIIGIDTAEMISEMESLGQANLDLGMDELDEDDSDFDDEEGEDDDSDDSEDEADDENEWVSILDEEDQEDESDGSLGDWAKLETMRSSHPIYFAKKLEEVVSDGPIDCMEQPSSGLSVHGLLRPALIEEHSVIQKHISGPESVDVNTNFVTEEQLKEDGVQINGHGHEKEQVQDNPLDKDEILGNGFAFYKLEMVKIQLFSALGKQTDVDIEDFKKAQPDAIAHSAVKIISHLKSGGEKTIQALKTLCWRCKGIQVEECALIGVDSLGFDLRVCSGTQIQTLRFAFKKKATSEYSAERQLNDILFPRAQKYQQKIEAQQTEL